MQKLKEEVRENIVKASKVLFKEQGFEETSIHDIAKKAGVSAGNIYRYFITKQRILDEILNEMETELIAFFDMLPSVYPLGNHEELFKNLFEKMISLSEEKNEELNILFKCETQVQFIRFKQKIMEIFVNKMEQLVLSVDDNKTVDKTLCAAFAISIFNGVSLIVRENNKNLNKLRENLFKYKEVIIDDLDKKMLRMAI